MQALTKCIQACNTDRMEQKDGVVEFAAMGGRARAKKLSPTERSAIARQAAAARWGTEPLPQATNEGLLTIGDMVIPCAVLDDGTRLLSQRAFTKAIGAPQGGHAFAQRQVDGVAGLPIFLAHNKLKPFIDLELAASLSAPVEFFPKHGGRSAFGIKAQLIPAICDVWLKAREANVLSESQKRIAHRAELLTRGLAHVGIIALVDEATGYQDTRARDALAKILEAFVTKELRKWVKTFPIDYFKELCRLREVPFPADKFRLPSYFGHLTNDVVYDRLAPGVRAELNRLTPRDEKGRLKQKLFQRLTVDVGHPKLREHLSAVLALMRVSATWDDFEALLNKALPKFGDLPLFYGLDGF